MSPQQRAPPDAVTTQVDVQLTASVTFAAAIVSGAPTTRVLVELTVGDVVAEVVLVGVLDVERVTEVDNVLEAVDDMLLPTLEDNDVESDKLGVADGVGSNTPPITSVDGANCTPAVVPMPSWP